MITTEMPLQVPTQRQAPTQAQYVATCTRRRTKITVQRYVRIGGRRLARQATLAVAVTLLLLLAAPRISWRLPASALDTVVAGCLAAVLLSVFAYRVLARVFDVGPDDT